MSRKQELIASIQHLKKKMTEETDILYQNTTRNSSNALCIGRPYGRKKEWDASSLCTLFFLVPILFSCSCYAGYLQGPFVSFTMNGP